MFAYLAHPIDQAGHSSWLGSMLGDLNTLLVQAGIGAFRPGMAYLANTGDHDHAAKINDLNNIAIHQADCLIAVLPADVPTLGTPVEIGLALSMRKPVVVLTDIGHSVLLAAWSARGAVIVDMGAGDFKWPLPQELRDWLDASATLVKAWEPQYQQTSPPNPFAGIPVVYNDDRMNEPTTGTLELFKPPPYLITGEAANASRGKYAGDAGIDLAINKTVMLDPGQYKMVPTGVYGAIPEGWFGLLTGRSSTWARHRCDVRQSIIDHGYRGELMLGIENRSDEVRVFDAGTRLGQIVLLPVFSGGLLVVDELPEAERGHNGYGSSDEPPTERIEVG